MLTSTDDLANVTTYCYNENTNVLEWIQYPNDSENSVTTNTYDSMYRLASTTASVSGLSSGTALTASYTYTNDLLTEIETGSTTYSFSYGDFAQRSSIQIGNLTSDGTWSYTWQNGRELATMSNGSVTWNYTCDANGMRTSRSNGSTTYNYVYNGDQLVQMTKGSDTLYFTYGAIGPTTVTWNGTTYYYAVNAQGDVMGIFDGSGNCVVTYNWDNAWGYNPEPEGSMADTLGTLNPLRYRSYVYDEETELYYLQSRYYDPEICRFINADAYTSTGYGLLGNNMYAYCSNNPANLMDDDGDFGFLASVLIGAAVGVASQFISGVVSNAIEGKTGADLFKETGTVGEYVTSALTGALCAIPGAGTAVSVICDVAAPAVQQGIDCVVYDDVQWSWEKYRNDVASNLVCDAVSNVVSVDSPKFIRDIKDEARSLGKKGTKALTKHLRKVQNEVFLINQGLDVTVSIAKEVYSGAFKKIISMF